MRRIVGIAFLLALAGYLTWDRVEAARLARAIAAMSARGEPTTEDEGYPQPRTPEQREASSLYAQAADAAREQAASDNNRASRLDVDKPGGTELSLPDITATYRDDDPALQRLDQATPLEFGGFGGDDRELLDNQLGLLDAGALACLRADLAATRGESDAAAAAVVPCVRLERTLYPELYRAQHAARLLGSLRILFRHGQPSDGSLAALQRAFESWPDIDSVVQEVLRQRARFIDVSEGPPGIARLATILLHPFALRDTLRGLTSFESTIAIARLPWAERREAAAESLRNARRSAAGSRGFLARWTGPPLVWTGFSVTQAALELAARRTMLAAIAIERFRRAHGGALPASLDALVPAFIPRVPEDPFSDKPLVYLKEAGSYVVYSVDADRHDDGGELYGFGSAVAKHVGPQSPRDDGIRVPLRAER